MRLGGVRAIALNTFREAIRDKILYLLVVFGLVLIGAARIISWLTVGAQIKIIVDVGLAAITIFGVLVAVFIGISLVQREIERRTIYTVVTKPIHRHEFILGKFAGLALTLLVMLFVMSALLQVAVFLKTGHASLPVLRACFLIYFELLVIVSIAILFSSFSTPILSFLLTLMLYVIGHLSYSLLDLAKHLPAGAGPFVLKVVYYVLPNLENFNLKAAAVHGLPVPTGFVLTSIEYGLVYVAAILTLSVIVFRTRDFT
ncbi:MAG: ABC transporter permease [Acidobacteria bacterium]|nr:ABC transporter permease [Acidobacteriota bacterium]